jgi:hypothetical protein
VLKKTRPGWLCLLTLLVSTAHLTRAAGSPPPSAPHPYQITSWDYVGDGGSIPSIAAIKQAIYTYGPVGAAMCVGDHFRDYTGGVFQTNETCSLVVNHAIVLVGWDDSEQAWILRNSWGPDWGESGYMRIRYGTSSVGFAANYVVHSPPVTPDRTYLPMVAPGSGAAHTLSNGDFEGGSDGSWSEYSTGGWEYQQVDVTGWRGQTVELRFVVETDWLWRSSFFLDDVSISTATALESHLTR